MHHVTQREVFDVGLFSSDPFEKLQILIYLILIDILNQIHLMKMRILSGRKIVYHKVVNFQINLEALWDVELYNSEQ